MKALILRDLKAYMLHYISMMTVIILYAYLNVRFGSTEGFLGFVLILMPSVTGIILFIGDSELIPLMASMPVTRRQLVVSKYISFSIIGLMLLSLIIAVVWFLGSIYTSARLDLLRLLSPQGLVFALFPSVFIVSFCYPLLFRFGLQVGVRILLGIFGLAYGMGMVVMERVVQKFLLVPRRGVFVAVMTLLDQVERHISDVILYPAIALLLLVTAIISVRLSCRWFIKRDLD